MWSVIALAYRTIADTAERHWSQWHLRTESLHHTRGKVTRLREGYQLVKWKRPCGAKTAACQTIANSQRDQRQLVTVYITESRLTFQFDQFSQARSQNQAQTQGSVMPFSFKRRLTIFSDNVVIKIFPHTLMLA